MTPQNTSYPLNAATRSVTGKQVSSLRNEGKIPAVVYGYQQESLAITLDNREFSNVLREAGYTSLIDLTIDEHKSHKTLVHDVQFHPSKGTILHVDLYQVNMKEKVQTEVPLEFVGTSPAIEIEGGSLLAVKSEIEIECLPQDLIHGIEVDISKLQTFDDDIRVSDLTVPAGIEVLTDAEELVAKVEPPRSEEEMEALDAAVEGTNVDEIESETASGTETPTEGEEGEDKKEEE